MAAASIIPGYEYDIFISYRQKDNKQLGWVIEYVVKASALATLSLYKLTTESRSQILVLCFGCLVKNDRI